MSPAQEARRLEWDPFLGGDCEDGSTATVRAKYFAPYTYTVDEEERTLTRIHSVTKVKETIPYGIYPKAQKAKLAKRFSDHLH